MPEFEIITGTEIGVGNGAIHAPERTKELQWRAELNKALKGNLVAVDPSLPVACIDGRVAEGTLGGDKTEPRAAIAGGQTTPYAAAELVGWFRQFPQLDDTDASQRLAFLSDFLESKGIVMGSHVDTKNAAIDFSEGATGCGAADKLIANTNNIYEYAEGVQGFVSLLSGATYEPDLTFESRDHVLEAVKTWNSVDALRSLPANNVEVLRADNEGVSGHREFSVVFNFVPDTTIDRDSFFAETKEQVFTVDVWYIEKLAAAMAGNNSAQIQALKQAMLSYQIGTYLSLCDGSQTYTTIAAATQPLQVTETTVR